MRDRRAAGRGFTLVEMLISLAIFGVITGMVLANFRAGAQGDELRISSQLVASAVRRAQSLAIAGQTVAFCRGGANDLKLCPGGVADCTGGTCVTEVPAAFGIHFSTAPGEERRMTQFADTDNDKTLGPGEAMRSDSISSGPFVDVVGLAPEVGGALDIVFVPPKPSTVFNADAAPDGIAAITVRHRTTGAEKRVTVNKVSGQVSAE
jgi:prepilin-type N-terminal cleavage/methylation domain-containing protein